MSSELSGRMWNLKEEAKWARDSASQMKAIRAINTREEIRQCCSDAIKSANNQSPTGLTNVENSEDGKSFSKENINNKKNQHEERIEALERTVAERAN